VTGVRNLKTYPCSSMRENFGGTGGHCCITQTTDHARNWIIQYLTLLNNLFNLLKLLWLAELRRCFQGRFPAECADSAVRFRACRRHRVRERVVFAGGTIHGLTVRVAIGTLRNTSRLPRKILGSAQPLPLDHGQNLLLFWLARELNKL